MWLTGHALALHHSICTHVPTPSPLRCLIFIQGDTEILLTARDAAQKETNATFKISVKDSIAPEVKVRAGSGDSSDSSDKDDDKGDKDKDKEKSKGDSDKSNIKSIDILVSSSSSSAIVKWNKNKVGRDNQGQTGQALATH
jgi:hypothetical protein